jgi:hypothetical protein
LAPRLKVLAPRAQHTGARDSQCFALRLGELNGLIEGETPHRCSRGGPHSLGRLSAGRARDSETRKSCDERDDRSAVSGQSGVH